ncbi:class I SAM-dependent methyltransferase [Bradyrhizobium sp.]|uniref:class I SAM-dependent methyltransferase n=1 Tax=Bradyrhizobium sp. TaxID=376 RepID=UPI001D8D8921|nr:class I SAM-dependent methyltransferase [Bradyrhizobium sp.]MBI5321100.1 class I SAM-dependent methyltransferase [Bradyrhizobium sp.]
MSLQSQELHNLYDNYYTEVVAKKRAIAAIQSVDHLDALTGGNLGSVLDVGSGEGAVLQELDRRGSARTIDAVEISASGIERINSRHLASLRSVKSFDGYTLPFPDKTFDTAIAIHVLEHVEHERLFLREMARVARRVYVEVPLEHTVRLKRSIAAGRPFGHINHYTHARFLNLLETSGLVVQRSRVFSNSLPYEQFLAGTTKGSIKHAIRSGLLKIAPGVASNLMVYLGAAVCVPQSTTS